MDYRYFHLCVVFLLSTTLWQVTIQQSNAPSKKEKLKNIPDIPEMSSNVQDPTKWKNSTRLIFFYSPWCEHSNSMKPLLYDVIEEVYQRNISGIIVGQIDVSVNSDVARTFRIKTTPTLLLFQNGTRYEFDDDPAVERIVEFISNIMSPSVKEIHRYSELKELQDHYPVLFLLVYDEEIDPDWETVFTQVSKERILIAKFFFTLNTSIPTELGLSLPSLPKLMVLKDGQAYLYTDTLTKYKMTLWVEGEQFPALPFTNRTTFRPIVAIGNSKRLAILFVSTITTIPLNQRKAVEVVRRVAERRKLHSGYQFVVLDDNELIYKMTSQYLSPPSLFVWEKKTGLYYIYDSSSGFIDKTISSFLFSITSGKVKESGGPTMRSTIFQYYWLAYNLIQAMLSHRPLLSVVAIVCLGVGFSVCLYSRRYSKNKREFKKKLQVTRAVRKQRRNTNDKAQEQETNLRRRRTNNTGKGEGSHDEDEVSHDEGERSRDEDERSHNEEDDMSYDEGEGLEGDDETNKDK